MAAYLKEFWRDVLVACEAGAGTRSAWSCGLGSWNRGCDGSSRSVVSKERLLRS